MGFTAQNCRSVGTVGAVGAVYDSMTLPFALARQKHCRRSVGVSECRNCRNCRRTVGELSEELSELSYRGSVSDPETN